MAGNSPLNHAFTQREKVLLGVLAFVIVAAVYYYGIVANVTSTLEANEERMDELTQQIAVQQTVADSCASMRAEIETLGDITKLPQVGVYDNVRAEFDELNQIFGQATSYQLVFMDPQLTDKTVRREARITFECGDYAQADTLIRQLEAGPYRCQVNDVTLTGKLMADGSIGSVTANVTCVFYETVNGSTNQTGLEDTSASSN